MKLLILSSILLTNIAFAGIGALAQPATPAWLSQVKLSAINGTDDQKLAIINNKTFSPGEANSLKLKGRTVQVKCLEIRERSVLVRFQDLPTPYELTLGGELVAIGVTPEPAASPPPAVKVTPAPSTPPVALFTFKQPASHPPPSSKSAISLGLLVFFAGIFLALLTGIALGAGVSRLRYRQNIGEAMIAATIDRHFSRPHLLLNNVTLPTAAGTTQIDHILVADTGIFVIEAKHYSGWIFGDPKERQWTQAIYRKKSRFQNPLHQNFGHVRALQSLFDLPENHFHSLVVFTGDAEFKTDLGPEVVKLSGLIPLLTSERPVLYDERKLTYIVGRIEMKRARRSLETDEYHINHLRRRLEGMPEKSVMLPVFTPPAVNPIASASGDEKYQPKP
jgi:hypothetical protein